MADELVLASGSPRRAKILSDLGVRFRVLKTDAAEVSFPHDPERTVSANAVAKLDAALAALAARDDRGWSGVLAADTIVWFAGRIYGKPRDFDEAKVFLRELSGNTHTVFTGVAYESADGSRCVECCRSDVTFRILDEAAISTYVERVRPLDRAGAYDIDESGDLLVASTKGSYENIMGLPVEPLDAFGILRGDPA